MKAEKGAVLGIYKDTGRKKEYKQVCNKSIKKQTKTHVHSLFTSLCLRIFLDFGRKSTVFCFLFIMYACMFICNGLLLRRKCE